jgi:hypothetical protein
MEFPSLFTPVGNDHRVWLREISDVTFIDQQLDDLGGDGGLFVAVETLSDGTMAVLAKAPDYDRGRTLMALVAEGLAKAIRNSTGKTAIYELPERA